LLCFALLCFALLCFALRCVALRYFALLQLGRVSSFLISPSSYLCIVYNIICNRRLCIQVSVAPLVINMNFNIFNFDLI
jgi:hypothetical protein